MAAQKKNGDESLEETEEYESLEEKEEVGNSADDSNDAEEGYDESEEETEEEEDAALNQIAKRSGAKVNIKLPIPNGLPFAVEYEGGKCFFVRKCYDVYYVLVVKLLKEGKKCITLTGTPGIGKSIFYAYFFDRFCSEHKGEGWVIVASTYRKGGTVEQLSIFEEGKKPTILPTATPEVLKKLALRFAGVYETADGEVRCDPDKKRKVLYLCDGPPDITYTQAVVFTSPDNAWLNRVTKDRCTYWMPPWKLKELQLAAAVLDYPMSDEELKERFWSFGGVARHCLSLDPEAVPEAIDELQECLTSINDRGDLENLLLGRENKDTRHRFLHYKPIGTGRRKDTKLVSKMLCEELAERLLLVMQRSIRDVELMLDEVPQAASLRGWVFERNAHAILRAGLQLRARPLASAEDQTKVFSVSKTAELAVFKTDALTPSLLTSSGPYHTPKSKNLESIDGFYFSREAAKLMGEQRGKYMENKPILLFQMTVSKRHPVRASGIIYVLRKLGLLETVNEKPKRAAIVFLHPHAKGFKRQNIIVSGGSPESLEAIGGIGPLTLKTLALYGVTTVEGLKNGIKDFREGKIIMQDSQLKEQGTNAGKGKKKKKKKIENESESNVSKHRADWKRALRCWELHVESLSDSKYIKMVESIPQYVSDAGHNSQKRKAAESEEGGSKMSKRSKERNNT